jgi:hypothetical protein
MVRGHALGLPSVHPESPAQLRAELVHRQPPARRGRVRPVFVSVASRRSDPVHAGPFWSRFQIPYAEAWPEPGRYYYPRYKRLSSTQGRTTESHDPAAPVNSNSPPALELNSGIIHPTVVQHRAILLDCSR